MDTALKRNLIWAARRFYIVGFPVFAIGLLAGVAFWIPFQLTSKLARMANLPVDQRSTFNLLVGILVYGLWIAILGTIVARTTTLAAGIATAVVLPVLGLIGMLVRERWRGAWQDVRRYLTLRSRRELINALARRQRALACELQQLYRPEG